MAGREYLLKLCRWASRRAVVISLVAVCLAGTSLISWQQAAAGRSVNAVTAPASPEANAVTAGSLISLNGLKFAQSDGVQGASLGDFEGYFDGKTRSFSLQPKGEGAAGKGNRQAFRSDPSGDVPSGASGFTFRVVRSDFVNTADNPATVVGEIELTNNTSATLYNTRIVFTSFKLSNSGGADAGNLPGAGGFAYFNDGQVVYNNKLSVSRAYGDIAAGGKVSQVWSFAVGNTPPSFFFSYKVIADIGVAAESVAPAAVQVSASTGTSVTINGRGFTGTPTVELLGGASPVALTSVSATGTAVTATVPAGTAAGTYSVRVTNPGGTAGGAGSSTLKGKLKVTGVPDAGHTVSGNIAAIADVGPYLISGNATIGSAVNIPAGTVIYVASGATITVSGGGNFTADGGIPGVAGTNSNQIVITAQRSPGAAVPTAGSWGGINATAAATSTMTLENVVVEYGGAAGSAEINLTGSGRTLRFTDSIVRLSAGAGISAAGAGDSLIGFARNRVDNNGTSATDVAVLVSGNASLGLYDINSADAATSVGDPSYYYSSANDFTGNLVNAIQVGTIADAASNDFSKSGVLVGQAPTPIRIAGSCANPAIVGAVPPATPAELTIGPSALIQLAADLNFQAGDYPSNRIGCIAANGYAGAYIGPKVGSATVNKLISFDKVPSSGNFGAIFFTRNAMANCILNYVSVQGGGAASACSLGNGEVIAEVIGLKVTNSVITGSATGGLLSVVGATVDSRGSTLSGNAVPIIDTIAGGLLGDGNLAIKSTIVLPIAIAIDPLGRGLYVGDSAGTFLIRFINTTRNTVTIGGQKIPAGAIRTVVGAPNGDPADNVPGATADVGSLSGLAVSKDGDLVYWIDQGASLIRVYNASATTKAVAGGNLAAGNVTTVISQNLGSSVNGLSVNPVSGEVYVIDATAGVNQVFKFLPTGGALTAVAGNGATTKSDDAFSPGSATGSPLLQPRAITFDPQGNLYIADTGHARVIKVDAGGSASLLAQFPPKSDSEAMPYDNNPFTTGLTFLNGKLYIANGNAQDIARIDSPGNFTTIAGTIKTSCDYSSDTCGDGGPIAQALFNLIGSTVQPPLVGLASDSKGIYVADQSSGGKGRIRYLNLSDMDAEVGGKVVAAGNVETIAGVGLPPPFNNGLATSASFNKPSGVGVDGNGNLWITDTLFSKLRFVNQGTTPIVIFAGTTAEQTVQPGVIVEVNKNIGDGPNDGAPVNYAVFDTPQGLAITPQGIFIADAKFGGTVSTGNKPRTSSIRFINTSSQSIQFYPNGATKVTVPPGNIAKIVGGSTDPNNVGDGANPLGAKLVGATDVAIHPTTGDIYIADAGNKRIRRVNRSTGAVSTILTGGTNDSYLGVSFDSAGRLLVANGGFKTGTGATANFGNSSVLREKASGQCATNATGCFDTILSGGAGSLLKNPRDVVEGSDGALYVTNAGPSELGRSDNKILRIVISGTTGTASVYANITGIQGYSGDGGPAINAQLNLASDDFLISTFGTPVLVSRVNITITIGLNGEIIFSDAANNAIRRIR
ncbi:MAG: IPT/TIG domain-containing protein [Acidobacteriota bacterium]